MDLKQFETACGKTLELLVGRCGPVLIEAQRIPEIPCSPQHIKWMLIQAALFYAEGKIEKANRWLGYTQGVLASVGVDLEKLKRCNMPEGEQFDGERV